MSHSKKKKRTEKSEMQNVENVKCRNVENDKARRTKKKTIQEQISDITII